VAESFLPPPLLDEHETETCKTDVIEDLGAKIEDIARQVEKLPESNYADVGHFHSKFGLPNATHEGVFPREWNREFMEFRLKFLQEELREITDALTTGDLVKVIDGLLDLNYVSHGTAQILGIPWQACWNEVQRANMAKEKATAENPGTRLAKFDIKKPAGWTPPDIAGILKQYGWTDADLHVEPVVIIRTDDTP
jgi:predicted HAD superfamily Cof-like phosphohydrolase